MTLIPTAIEDSAQYFAGVERPSFLWNHNNGPFLYKGDRYVTLTRWLKTGQVGTWQSLQVYKIGTGPLDAGNAVNIASPIATPTYPKADQYVTSRGTCSTKIWVAFFISQGTVSVPGSPGDNSNVAVKPFDLSTGLWGATSSTGPNITNAGHEGGYMALAVLSDGTLLLAYRISATGDGGSWTEDFNVITYTPGSDTWGTPLLIDGGNTNASYSIFGIQVDKSDGVHILFAFQDVHNNQTILRHVRWKAGVLSSVTDLATLADNFSNTAVIQNDWGKSDFTSDTITFAVVYPNNQNATPSWYPKTLSFVTVTSASGTFTASLEGIADVPRSGPFGFVTVNWFAPSCYTKDGNYNVSIMQKDTTTSPQTLQIRVWRRPTSGGAWVEQTQYLNVTTTGGTPDYAVTITDPPSYLVCDTLGLATLIEFTEGTVDLFGGGTTTKPRTYLFNNNSYDILSRDPCGPMELTINIKLAIQENSTLPAPPGGGGGTPGPAEHCVPDMTP